MKHLNNSSKSNNLAYSIRWKIAASIGSTFEWYDFALYGFFGLIFAKLFFPQEHHSLGILSSFMVFGLGFLARPLGGIFFGYLSDKLGRKIILQITPIAITIPTFLISILPDYSKGGIASSILLVTLRLLQGFFIGGEYANNLVYLCETAKPQRLFYAGSLASCAASLGILLASIITSICFSCVNEIDLYAFGWRIPFFISTILGILTLYMRKNIPESPLFKNRSKKIYENPFLVSIQPQKRLFFLAFLVTLLPASAFYFVFIFCPAFYQLQESSLSFQSFETNTWSLLIRLFLIPVIGIISDKIGGIKIAKTAALSFIIMPFLFMITLKNHLTASGPIILFFMGILTTLNAGTTPGILANIFHTNIRASALSIILNICFGVIGGLTPSISFYLFYKTNYLFAPCFLLAISGIITLIALDKLGKYQNHENSVETYTILANKRNFL